MFDIHFGDVLGHSIKLYALMTPPAVLSAFLGHTRNYDKQHKHAIAFKTSLSIFIISVVLYVWGAKIFEIFGFTLDAFRIGSGMLLMLAAKHRNQIRRRHKRCAPGHSSGHGTGFDRRGNGYGRNNKRYGRFAYRTFFPFAGCTGNVCASAGRGFYGAHFTFHRHCSIGKINWIAFGSYCFPGHFYRYKRLSFLIFCKDKIY